MNYVLQVIRGRSASTTLKLADGVNSIGRHDDCVIRIKSSQVSRRHCEIFEVGDDLTIRDLGSSNGTFVNGKRINGQHVLKAGDELTVGAVSLRVAKIGQAAGAPQGAGFKPKAGDTAEVEALVDDDEEEFEMEFDDSEAVPEIEGIPLADDEIPAAGGTKPAKTPAPAAAPQEAKPAPKAKAGSEEDAISEFLLDLDLDDDE
jgi:pSer/pThr/pTyr-binding forkhead associated (FHA) protein